ncbi:MAG: NAD-binding protein [Elusimicrobia bacterium]|nr:NAD-binding protein [Elusimicrobiota bacterium]
MNNKPLYIVLGWDLAAAQAAKSLLALGMDVAVVASEAPASMPQGVPFVVGEPDISEALKRAGIERAAGLLSALSSEMATRAFAAARALNPSIHIVSSLQDGDRKVALWASGAAEVIDAREEAALEMVRLMLEEAPANRDQADGLYWARVPANASPEWIGVRLAEVRGSLRLAAIACVWPGGDRSRAREDDDARITEGDTLIVLGTRSRLESLLRATGPA